MLALRQKNTKFYRSALLEKYNYETRRPPIVLLPARDQAALPLDRIPAIHPCRKATFLLPITAPRPAGLPGHRATTRNPARSTANEPQAGLRSPPCVRASLRSRFDRIPASHPSRPQFTLAAFQADYESRSDPRPFRNPYHGRCERESSHSGIYN